MRSHDNPRQAARLVRRLALDSLRSLGKPKVFCIGRNKTGTTSVATAFRELGFTVGIQSLGERLLYDWARRDFRRLFLYCRTAQAFQDVPFSWPFTYQALDQRFPGSKFVLTVRDSPEQWYDSLTRFHAALLGRHRLPTAADLKAARYVRPGWAYDVWRLVYGTPDDDLYNKERLVTSYLEHNRTVEEYFRHRPEDLFILNVAQPDAYDRLCRFLGKPCPGREFPRENRTADVEKRKSGDGPRPPGTVQGEPTDG
jgi:hypothetical protein